LLTLVDLIIILLTLPENSHIYASEYNQYLPDKTLLQSKLAECTRELEEIHCDTEHETQEWHYIRG